MEPTTPPQRRFAVLIDADNVSASALEGLIAEIANYGVAIVKRIYGDWTLPNLKSWKEQLLEHAIQPIQQFRYTVGKNATDSALIIDAMDLLFRSKLDGFCLVSSDSDFTRLASRIREEGLMVIGFGERKTPRAFVTACDRFVFTDILRGAAPEPENKPRKSASELKLDRKLVDLLRWAVEASEDDDGWANLGAVGAKIMSQTPDFDARSYGYGKLSTLVEATGLFEIERVTSQGGRVDVLLRELPPAAPARRR
ncbi:MAG: NYN domain-containing protein [Planctomycetes bacterium]|nr:NYN domain-containing protein [Planctomycetota bacterium]